ncbi:MAG TPA: hypothetical protein PLP26_06975 [Ilumatobacteraceae bacterium]|nr:hypothetical protein [Ilumatobacteraceae bacterium]
MTQPTRRSQLNAIKLRALVRDHLGVADGELPEVGEFGGGAALLAGTAAWVLLDERPERGLGAALAWALRRDAAELHVLADHSTGTLARRAQGFNYPINVWHVEGRTLLPAVAEPLPVAPAVPGEHQVLSDVIADGGALPVVEHGVLAGEVNGLEVCRVVTDAYTDEVRLEVGVGAHDREAFQMLHGNRPTTEALADVVSSVSAHRRPGAPRHPLNMLAQERALRTRLIAEPELIGASSVVAMAPPIPRPNVKDPIPCVALATIDGRSAVVVCSSGVDLDLVPYAIDARVASGVDDCLVVLPARDALDVQRRLAAMATPPLTVLTVG